MNYTFNQMATIVNKLGYTLYKESYNDCGDKYKYKVAKDYTQYSGGSNTPIRFKTLDEIESYFELSIMEMKRY